MEIPAPVRNRTCGDAERKREPGMEKPVETDEMVAKKRATEIKAEDGAN